MIIPNPGLGSGGVLIHDIKKGDTMEVEQLELDERFTGPPDYLTESDLITLMEKHGIGTDASIPVHINNIVQVFRVYNLFPKLTQKNR